MSITSRIVLIPALAACLCGAADKWSEPVAVIHDFNPCITYRAKLSGEYLVVEATLAEGWHTFTIDNKRRVEEKLAGKKALALDRPTTIKLIQGMDLTGPWMQTSPKDFSKPDLQLFGFGFEKQAMFAAKVKRTGAQGKIEITGQTCTDTTCKNIDVTLAVALPAASGKADVDLKALVPVK